MSSRSDKEAQRFKQMVESDPRLLVDLTKKSYKTFRTLHDYLTAVVTGKEKQAFTVKVPAGLQPGDKFEIEIPLDFKDRTGAAKILKELVIDKMVPDRRDSDKAPIGEQKDDISGAQRRIHEEKVQKINKEKAQLHAVK